MPTTPISKFPTFVGWQRETVPGTAVAATSFAPVTDASPEDVKNYTADEAWRGSAVANYGNVPTQGHGTYGFGGPVFMDTIGMPLKALLGAEDLSGAGPYVHVFAANNAGTMQPPTYTISDYNGNNTRQFPYAVCSQLEFTFGADGLLTYTTTWVTFPSNTASKPTQSFSAKTVVAGYKGVITIAGSATSDIESGTLTLTRDVGPVIAVNGSANPTAIYGGAVSAAASLTAIYGTNAESAYLANMLTGTSVTLDISYTNGADILALHASQFRITSAPISRGNNNWVELTVGGEAEANTTDANTAGGGYSPVKATLTNTASAAY